MRVGGLVSVTTYSGHPGGKLEEDAVLEWAARLNPRAYGVLHHRWLNRDGAPSVLIIERLRAE